MMVGNPQCHSTTPSQARLIAQRLVHSPSAEGTVPGLDFGQNGCSHVDFDLVHIFARDVIEQPLHDTIVSALKSTA